MLVASGPAECIAYNSRVMHNNINNSMLIDRVVFDAHYALAVLQSYVYHQIKAAAEIYCTHNQGESK